MIALALLGGLAFGAGLVWLLMRTHAEQQESLIDRLMTANSLGMPEDPREEVPEEDLPPLDQLFVPVPPEKLPANVAAGFVPPEDEPEPSENDLKKLGVDPEDEAIDRELFMVDQPRVEGE